ncbi:hypothetical protein [Thalassospira sp.]|uniref:hypothetical protein n=1 Tax=Thalassospira sp. TaxID=1912094 RepID=UPI00257B108F|nr:hypothetical protein [Thalassospira sp.]
MHAIGLAGHFPVLWKDIIAVGCVCSLAGLMPVFRDFWWMQGIGLVMVLQFNRRKILILTKNRTKIPFKDFRGRVSPRRILQKDRTKTVYCPEIT